MTKAERLHLDRVAQLPCVLCRRMGVGIVDSQEVHHIRSGQGIGERARHHLTIPLCIDCHRGKSGIHGDRSYLTVCKVSELDLLADTIELIGAAA